jgi:hypothetical protein
MKMKPGTSKGWKQWKRRWLPGGYPRGLHLEFWHHLLAGVVEACKVEAKEDTPEAY